MLISMGERGSGLRFWAVAASAWALAGSCAGETPPSDLGPPDLSKISVFYPVDGLVRGRGLAATVNDTRATHVRIASHPTKGETIVPVQSDGSFAFSVIAISGDLLEISAATDDKATRRGEPVYLVVPPTPLPPPNFVCCGARQGRNGTCQDEDSAAAGNPCPDAATGITQCQVDRDCGAESGEILPFDESRITITSPSAEGRITISGTVLPDALITMENRGQSAVGGYKPTQRRQVRITDKNGNFVFDSVVARGDDELIFQVHDLLGFRSPEASMLVPDAEIAGVDVTGAFAYSPLTPGQIGTIAFLLQPYGVDGRGICPNTDEDPILCLSGGLTHKMVGIKNLDIDGEALAAVPTTTTAAEPYSRGLLGGSDPLAGPQDLVIALDMSANAAKIDSSTPPQRFEQVRDFVHGLRSRDSVALVTFGGTIEARTGLVGGDHAAVLAELQSLESAQAAGPANVFQGISFSAALLEDARTRRPGRIIVITLSDEPGTLQEATASFDAAFDKVSENPSSGFPGWTVDVLAVEIPGDDANVTLLSDIAAFTRGQFYNVLKFYRFTVGQTLAELRSTLSGSFILLYDLPIPVGIGKEGTIRFTAEVALPESERVQADYSGPLLIYHGIEN